MSQTSTLPTGISALASDIKIAHTVFALPWALLAMVLAAHRQGSIQFGQVVLILVCMVTARTLAMTVNRLLDADIDAENPRTKARAIPSGRLTRRFAIFSIVACALGFILACFGFWQLYHNPWPIVLSLPVLGFLYGYPYLKRFSSLCHYYLGAALALAPVCAWVAIKGTLDAPPLWMAATVLLWTAGFDIIYACQDYACDVGQKLHSVPARLGIARALWVSRATHAGAAAMLIALAATTPELRWLFAVAVVIAIGLLIVEHTLVRADDLSKVGLSFFTVNGIISVVVGGLGISGILIGM